MATISYGPDSPEVRQLVAHDVRLAGLIERVGTTSFEVRDDRFTALARSIVGQQLSTKAARTIWSRIQAIVGDITAQNVVAADREDLSGAGLSAAKLAYMTDLATRVLDGEVELERLDDLDDEQVIQTLTKVKGIGRWTSEMFLIFALQRQDVFAVDDVGLRRGLAWLHGDDVVLDEQKMRSTIACWRPFRSIASLYLWEAVDLGLIRQTS